MYVEFTPGQRAWQMIRRDSQNDWLLISQVDHARLAAELAGVWGNDRVPPLPMAEQLVRAVRDHDNGWWSWEQSPEIDPAAGWPRNFTEMPMSTATRIWSESIDSAARGEFSHAAALRRLEQHLHTTGDALSWEDVQTLETVLQFRVPFTALDVIRQGGLADAGGTLDLMRAAGVIRRVELSDSREHFEVTAPALGPAPLPGIWVSRHFCSLAEQARGSRRQQVEELAALDAFLAEQTRRQAEWKSEALREFAGEHVERLIEAGFRCLQFFDRLSLWLCMAERTEPAEFDLPAGGRMEWTPTTPDAIEVEPWPFSAERLELSVPTRRIPARAYANDADLRAEISRSSDESLGWTLRPA